MSTSIGQISLDLGINLSGFYRDMRKVKKETKAATGNMGRMFTGLGSTIAAAFSVKAVVGFAKECISLGSDIAEVQNVVDVSFGDMKYKMEEFAESSIKNFGLSKLAAKQTGSSYMAMAVGMGMARDAASDMAIELTGLSADMASFYNINQSEARTALASVFTGETETLKRYGILMTEINLQEYARQQGITKSINKMTQQEKVMLRYNYVLNATKLAQGDFARTQGSWANQTRILTEQFNNLKATLGQAFINVLTPALRILNELLAKLQVFADGLYALSVELFGDAGGGSTSVAANAAEQLASNTQSAADAAKEYTKSLAGFDKLNVIGSEKSGGSGSAGGDTGATSGISVPKMPTGSTTGFDTSGIKNTLTEIGTIVGVSSLALGAILTFTGANIPLGLGLMALGAVSLAAAIKLDTKAMQGSVATSLDLITASLSGGLLAIGAILAFTGANMPLGIGLMAVGAVGLATTAALNWDATTNQVKMAITGIASALGTGLLAIGAILAFSGVALPLGIALMVAGAVSLGSAVALNWGALKESVGATASSIGAIVGGGLLALGAILAFTGVAIPLGVALMAGGALSLGSAIAMNWNGVSDKTKNVISVITGIAGGALLALGVILLLTGAGIPLGLGMIAAGGATLVGAIAPNWDKIVNGVKTVCGKIGTVFSNMLTGIKNGFKTAINGLIGLANKFIDGLNLQLIPIRAIIVGVAKAFGKDMSFNDVKIPHIPALANGGYVKANTPQLAMIGDNRHEGEIVAPESKITEAVAAALGPIVAAMQQLGAVIKSMPSGNGQTIVKCILDGKVIYETVVKQNNKQIRQTGKSALRV